MSAADARTTGRLLHLSGPSAAKPEMSACPPGAIDARAKAAYAARSASLLRKWRTALSCHSAKPADGSLADAMSAMTQRTCEERSASRARVTASARSEI